MKRYYFLSLFLLLVLTGYGQNVSIKEGILSLPTYPFSDPNPVAKPDNLYYPYFRFDGYAHTATPRDWKTVEMENDFIKLTVLPEIGGKVWGAVEKSTGREFIYFNHSVKFRDIAMRGAWTSGGIEFNFGIIGHAPTTSTPVDYFTRTNADGSVSCFVSATEYLTRTTWTVEINLPKDKAYFTTHTTWANTSMIDQPYYQWMNAGYKADGNLEFCYPGQYYIGHGGDVHSFPTDEEGRSISWYESNNFGADKSYHVLGKYNDYYGAYWHDDDFGSVHYAPYDEKPGMKIFLWGLSREGGIWEDLLTDVDGQYVELQSGRMFNQPATQSAYTPYKHFSFLPGITDHWTEYWFPVKETGGISKVSPLGTLHVVRHPQHLEVTFSPLQEINSSLVVKNGKRALASEPLRLHTLETWKKNIPLSATETPVTIEIGNKELVWHEAPEAENLSRPVESPADFDWESTYGLYVAGAQCINQKLFPQAEGFLQASLEKDPYFLPALNKMASLCYRNGRSEEGLAYSKKSLSLDTYDGEANYLYGLVNLRLNRLTDAKDGFSIASYSAAYRTAAYAMLAHCFLLEKDWTRAAHYANYALETNPLNPDAVQSLLVAYRYLGKKEEALGKAKAVLYALPLSHPVRFEEALLESPGAGFTGFTSLIQNEFPQETYIELAGWYESVGLLDEASQLLAFAGDHPLAVYLDAYISYQAGNKEESWQKLQKATGLSPELVFPFRPEQLPVLEWAAETLPSWETTYYTALLYWHLGDKTKALELLEACGDVPFAPFYLSRASLKWGQGRLDDILKAEKLDASWRVGMALINYYFSSDENGLALQTGKRYYTKYPANYMLGLKYAKALRLNQKYDESLALLKKIQVLPNEGAYEGRAIYKEASLYQAINNISKKRYNQAIRSVENSKEWIENLGVGKPFEENIDTRIEDFIMAVIYEKLNQAENAKLYYQKIADRKLHPGRYFRSTELLSALALRKLNRQAEADEIAGSWLAGQPDSKIAQWSAAVYNGETKKAQDLLSAKYTIEESTPWEVAHNDYNFTIISELFQTIPF